MAAEAERACPGFTERARAVDGPARRGHGGLRRPRRRGVRLRQLAARRGPRRRLRPGLRLPGLRPRLHPAALLRGHGPLPLGGAVAATPPTSPPPTAPCSSSFPTTSRWPAGSAWPRSGCSSRACPPGSAGWATASATVAGLRFNEMVRRGELAAPIVIGRDHLDCGSVASPYRETEAMRDGSDAIADWPLLNALVNAASGASWVSIHHGGGVGIGRSIHAGQVCVADGTPLAAAEAGAGPRPTTRAWASSATSTPATSGPTTSPGARGRASPWRAGERRRAGLAATAGPHFRGWLGLAASEPLGRLPAASPGPTPTSACREWFTEQAAARDLAVETDRNGNLWAWWGRRAERHDAVVTGSHLDSVPDGGAYRRTARRGSAPAAVDVLRERGGAATGRPLAVASFAEEEGARFGVACLGCRLLTGERGPDAARALRDPRGDALAEAMAAPGVDPATSAATRAAGRIVGCSSSCTSSRAAASSTGRRRRAGHRDLAARPLALRLQRGGQPRRHHPDGGPPRPDAALRRDRAGRPAGGRPARRRRHRSAGSRSRPTATNAMPSQVDAWLDARAADERRRGRLVAEVCDGAGAPCRRHGVARRVTAGVAAPAGARSPTSSRRTGGHLGARPGGAPALPTGAGHDAGVLAAGVPTAMLFVRNPTGVSHSPAEHADRGRLPGRRRGARRRRSRSWPAADPLPCDHAWLGGPEADAGRDSCESRGTDQHRRSGAGAAPPDAPSAARAHRCRASPTATATRSTGRCGAAPRRAGLVLDLARADVRRGGAPRRPTAYHELARAAYAEMALAGITCVGEFHYLHHPPDGTPYADPNEMGRRAARGRRRRRHPDHPARHLLPRSGGFGRPLEGVAAALRRRRRARLGRAGVALARSDPRPVGAAIHSVRAVPPEQLGVVAAWATQHAAAPARPPLRAARRERRLPRGATGCTPTRCSPTPGPLVPGPPPCTPPTSPTTTSPLLGRQPHHGLHVPHHRARPGRRHRPGPRALADAGVAALASARDSHAVIDLFEEARAVELDERLVTRASAGTGRRRAAGRRRPSTATPRSAGRTRAGSRPGGVADLVTVDLDIAPAGRAPSADC